MRLFTTLLLTFILLTGLAAQNNSNSSYINNCDFEITNWQDIAWFGNTNMGSPIIVNQNDAFFSKDHIEANSGLHFAYIGGVQTPGGLYEGQLIQEFNIPTSGEAKLNFYVRYVRGSVDPGSFIKIKVDGEEVWSISPHYIVDASEDYEMKSVELGNLAPGNHTIEVTGYENPIGGDVPMQFVFDDFILQSLGVASLQEETNIGLSVTCLPGLVQIQTKESLNEEVVIEFVDLNGKTIATTVTYFQNSYSLPINSMNSGMYILNLKTKTQILSRKLFIQH